MPTSGSKLNALIGKVRINLNELGEEYWNNTDLAGWIQDAKNLTCKVGNFSFMQHIYEANFVLGATTVPKPSDIKEMISLYIAGQKSDFIEFGFWQEGNTAGWTWFGDNFLIPTAVADGVLKAYYYRFIPDITDDVSYFDPYYESILVDYATRRARIKEEVLAPDQLVELEKETERQLDLIRINEAKQNPRLGSFRALPGI